MRASSAPGFTLIEVLVALLLSGIVAIGVHDIFGTLADDATRVTAGGEAIDAVANADRFVRALVANTETDFDPGSEFGGGSTAAVFTSWCQTQHGWLERCRVTLSIEPHSARDVLVAHLSTGESLQLREFDAGAQLRYLADLTAGGQWTDRWTPGPLVPRAIGVVDERDTVVLRIGDRG
jgi:prepilin-type N-terminal cleavage/methylation domain-containing protein